MVLLSAEKLCKGYTEKQLLNNADLTIQEGEKIGLIGVNGTGKSTLLKIMAGIDQPDSGSVIKAGGIRIGWLPQSPVFSEDMTVLEQVLDGLNQQQKDFKEYECKSILNKLGITDFSQKVNLLSGGQKKRVAMAQALVHETEVLIMDEPTNHIDNETVQWLESYLARYNGALLMVTHDRYFLEKVCNRIVELDKGSLYSYPANYSKYLELKAERLEMAAATERKRQSLLKKELAWIQRGARARSTKQQFRVNRFHEMNAQKAELPDQQLELSSMSSRLGKKIIEINHVSKSFGDKVLMQDFSYNLLRDDRIGIIGENGCGKSTLLKMIMGQTEPDSGSIDIGSTVRIGYFSQEGREMDPNQRVIEFIKDIAVDIETPDGVLTASQMLEKFLFDSTLQYTTIGRLSGGERRRLFLLSILIQAPNVLLLDEPTNDLDIQTLTILEDYLETFAGAVIAVSHDRYFLDKVADHLFAYENGEIHRYIGGYSDYLAEKKQQGKPVADNSSKQEKSNEKPKREREKTRFSFKEQREFDEIDGVIASLEKAIEEAQQQIDANSSDYTVLQEWMDKKSDLEQQLEEKMERWVYLNDLNEQFQK